MEVVDIPLPPLIFPGCCLLAGPSGSGKSTLLASILRNRDLMFTEKIDHMIFCHAEAAEEQFETIAGLELYQGLPDSATLDTWTESHAGTNLLICFDDLQLDFYNSSISESLLGRLSHHRGIYVLVLGQSIFPKAKHARQASLQYHTIILTRSCRDTISLQALATQVFGAGSSRKFLAAYLDATQLKQGRRPSYILIQMHPIFTHPHIRVFTNVLPAEAPIIAYKI